MDGPAETCPYYNVRQKELVSKIIRADRMRSVQLVQIPWCAHPKHSPYDRTLAYGGAFGGPKLTCGGDRAKCQITPAELFDDVD